MGAPYGTYVPQSGNRPLGFSARYARVYFKVSDAKRDEGGRERTDALFLTKMPELLRCTSKVPTNLREMGEHVQFRE